MPIVQNEMSFSLPIQHVLKDILFDALPMIERHTIEDPNPMHFFIGSKRPNEKAQNMFHPILQAMTIFEC